MRDQGLVNLEGVHDIVKEVARANPNFSQHIDNVYQGHWLAIWTFSPVVMVKMVHGANVFFNTRTVIENADRIPVRSYSDVSSVGAGPDSNGRLWSSGVGATARCCRLCALC